MSTSRTKTNYSSTSLTSKVRPSQRALLLFPPSGKRTSIHKCAAFR